MNTPTTKALSPYREWLHEVTGSTTLVLRDALGGRTPNHCIEWCRTMTAVCDRIGLSARAVPVNVLAGNHAATQSVLRGIPLTEADDAAGAWTVGVWHGQDHEGSGWNGHLVVVIRNPDHTRTLVDGTADQLSRPAKKIIVDPIVMLDLPSLWVAPIFTLPRRNRGVVRYEPMPPQVTSAQSWRTSNAWTKSIADELADAIVAHLPQRPE